MKIDELERHEQVALVALLGLMARLDFRDEGRIEAELEGLAAGIGSNFHAIAEEAASLEDGKSILAVAAKVKRPDARQLIFETLYARAISETIVDPEEQVLERLGKLWRIPLPAAEPDSAGDAEEAEAPEHHVELPSPNSVKPTKRALWFELIAVQCIYYFPVLTNQIFGTAWSTAYTAPGRRDWRDWLFDLVRVTFTAIALVFVMVRSGEPLARFGLVRARWHQFVLGGVLLLFVESTLQLFFHDIGLIPRSAYHSAHSHGPIVLIVAYTLASASVQELAMRGYLITRLQDLFLSRSVSVTLAAILFASYHAYQGVGGVMQAFITGLVYGAVFCFRRSLAPLIFAHTAHNLWVTLR